MVNRTHRIFNGSSAFVATTAVGLPPVAVAAAVGGAVIAASLPDNAEKILRVPHRRLTHWPSVQVAFFAAMATAVAIYAPEFTAIATVVAASLAFGCVLHSVADAMTVDKNGIQLAWPISRRGFHIIPWSWRVWVGNNSPSERRFVVIWCVFVLIYAYARYRHLILS